MNAHSLTWSADQEKRFIGGTGERFQLLLSMNAGDRVLVDHQWAARGQTERLQLEALDGAQAQLRNEAGKPITMSLEALSGLTTHGLKVHLKEKRTDQILHRADIDAEYIPEPTRIRILWARRVVRTLSIHDQVWDAIQSFALPRSLSAEDQKAVRYLALRAVTTGPELPKSSERYAESTWIRLNYKPLWLRKFIEETTTLQSLLDAMSNRLFQQFKPDTTQMPYQAESRLEQAVGHEFSPFMRHESTTMKQLWEIEVRQKQYRDEIRQSIWSLMNPRLYDENVCPQWKIDFLCSKGLREFIRPLLRGLHGINLSNRRLECGTRGDDVIYQRITLARYLSADLEQQNKFTERCNQAARETARALIKTAQVFDELTSYHRASVSRALKNAGLPVIIKSGHSRYSLELQCGHRIISSSKASWEDDRLAVMDLINRTLKLADDAELMNPKTITYEQLNDVFFK